MSFTEITTRYTALKTAAKTRQTGIALDLFDPGVTDCLDDLYSSCLEYLIKVDRENLLSKVADKEYFSFVKAGKLSRPINKGIFEQNELQVAKFFNCLKNREFSSMTAFELSTVCYTIASSFCAIIDLEKIGDQKTPGTFFEYFIGHIFARLLNCNPRKRVEVLNIEYRTSLPTDLIFDLGESKPKFHVPVKTSTRERVIQVWAHQRVLDGVYGMGRFSGVLFCLAEVKLDRRSREVVEICLPDQWRLYQMFIAQMTRVYYLDPPKKYLELAQQYPKIEVREIGQFFKECTTIA